MRGPSLRTRFVAANSRHGRRHIAHVNHRPIHVTQRNVIELASSSGLLFIATSYSIVPIFTCRETRPRSCARTALVTPGEKFPARTGVGIQVNIDHAGFPPYGTGTAAPLHGHRCVR